MIMDEAEVMVLIAQKLKEVHEQSHQSDIAIMELVNAMAKRLIALEKQVAELMSIQGKVN